MRVITVVDVGINHNADLDTARKLIDVAALAGVDYVKFQKRTPELCVPDAQKNVLRETPWGAMTYLEYRHRMEFGKKEYLQLADYCEKRRIKFFFSVWDEESVDFVRAFDCDFIKIPSACLTDSSIVAKLDGGDRVIASSGMSDWALLDNVDINPEYLLHCVSTYPSTPEEQNLRVILNMKERYPMTKIGFSNHFPGVLYIPIAVALGAEMVEWHITLDRAMWGTDQAASIEPEGTFKIVKYINSTEKAMGNGEKVIFDREVPIMQKLRRCVG